MGESSQSLYSLLVWQPERPARAWVGMEGSAQSHLGQGLEQPGLGAGVG